MSDYITPEEARRWTGAPIDDQTGDLESVISAVTAMIDAYCQRNFSQSISAARDFVATNAVAFRLGPFNDLVSVSAVETDDGTGTFATTVATSGYALEPVNTAGPETRPYTSIRRISGTWPVAASVDARQSLVRLTGIWGWPAVPEAVRSACRIQVARIFKRTDSPLGVAGFGDFGAVRISSRLDPDVQQMLDPYRIIGGIA